VEACRGRQELSLAGVVYSVPLVSLYIGAARGDNHVGELLVEGEALCEVGIQLFQVNLDAITDGGLRG